MKRLETSLRKKSQRQTDETNKHLNIQNEKIIGLSRHKTTRFIDQEEISSSPSSESDDNTGLQNQELRQIKEESKNSARSFGIDYDVSFLESSSQSIESSKAQSNGQ